MMSGFIYFKEKGDKEKMKTERGKSFMFMMARNASVK